MLGNGAENGLDEAERWVDDWQAGIEERAAKARALSQRLAQVTTTARSRDGLVEATVDSSGALVTIHLDEGIRNQPAARTAEEIMAQVHAAQAKLPARIGLVAAETVGPEDPTARAIIASYTDRFQRPDGNDADGER
jgi:DNA-binding protein YbaB